MLDKELSLKNSGRSLDTSPFSVTSVDSAIGDVYSSNSMDMNRYFLLSIPNKMEKDSSETMLKDLLIDNECNIGLFRPILIC